MISRKWIFILLVACILSAISVFRLVQTNDIPQPNRIEHKVGSAVIYCDERRGANNNLCIGSYERGWPITYVHGFIVGAKDGRWNEQSDISYGTFLINTGFFALTLGGLLKIGERTYKKLRS